jgi:hypothetical protein
MIQFGTFEYKRMNYRRFTEIPDVTKHIFFNLCFLKEEVQLATNTVIIGSGVHDIVIEKGTAKKIENRDTTNLKVLAHDDVHTRLADKGLSSFFLNQSIAPDDE